MAEPENIVLARFGIDTRDVMKETSDLKKTIGELRGKLSELRKSEEDTTQQQVATEAQLKALNAQYNQNIKVLQANAREQTEGLEATQKANVLLNEQAKSIEGLRFQNAELNKVRNALDVNKDAELIQQLNERINQNTDVIKQNVDAYSQQKMNVGNYADSIKEALGSFEMFGIKVPGSIKEATDATKGMGLSGEQLSGQLKGLATGIAGVTRASLAFIATPIGAILAAISIAIGVVTAAMSRSEESVDKLKEAFAPFMGILDALMGVIADYGKLVIDVFVKNLEMLQKAVTDTIEGLAWALEKLGLADWADGMRNFADSVEQAAESSRKLAIAERELTEFQRENKVAVSELAIEVAELKAIRDDSSKSLAEREKAALKVQKLETEKIQKKLIEAQKEYEINQMLIAQKGRTTELLDKEAELLAKINGIKGEQFNLDRESTEKLNNIRQQASQREKAEADRRASEAKQRRDEQARAQQKAIDDRLKGLAEEIEFEKEAFGWRAKTLQQELEEIESLNEKRKNLLDEQLENGKISRVKYNTEILKLDSERAKKQAEIAVDLAQLELEAFQKMQAEKQADKGYLSENRLAELKESNEQLFNEQVSFEKTRLEQGLISETEYNKAIQAHKEEMDAKNRELQKQREQNEKEEALAQRAIDFEIELELMREEGATKFDLELAMLQEQNDIKQQELEDAFQNNLISQQEYNLRSLQLSRELSDAETRIEQAKAQMKLNLTKGLLTAIGGEIDEASGVGKAIALAQAGINMYEGITADLKLGWPMSLIAIAKDTVTGLGAIRKIASTKIPSATGSGSVGGGGTIPSGIGSTGLRYDTTADATTLRQLEANELIDVDEMSNAVADGARRGTTDGMVELTENRNIQNASTF